MQDQRSATEPPPPTRAVRRERGPRVALEVWQAPQWKLMREALADGRRIVSFDAEWQYQPPNQVTELGAAILHGGVITIHNIRVKPGGRPFKGGKTVYMTDDEAKTWLRATMASAELLVGHALQNDRHKMKQWKCPLPNSKSLPVVDTGAWSRATNPVSANPRRLTHLAAEYGVDCSGSHVAGNDAHVTLQVALAMAQAEEAVSVVPAWCKGAE
jgi:hypothetical protein